MIGVAQFERSDEQLYKMAVVGLILRPLSHWKSETTLWAHAALVHVAKNFIRTVHAFLHSATN